MKLTEGAAEDFSYLTEMNVGNNLIVLAGESELSKASIGNRIELGHLVSDPLTEPEGRDFLSVLEQLPSSPCGVAKQSSPVDVR